MIIWQAIMRAHHTPLLGDLMREELSFPEQICTTSNESAYSSLGAGSSGGFIQIGNGKYIPSSFIADHSNACCLPTDEFVKSGTGSFSDRRRKRNRCRVCGKNTTCQCNVCHQWVCSESSYTERKCFQVHKKAQIANEQEDHWQSLQAK